MQTDGERGTQRHTEEIEKWRKTHMGERDRERDKETYTHRDKETEREGKGTQRQADET